MKYLELLNRVRDCARKSEKAADALSTASNNSNVQEREARKKQYYECEHEYRVLRGQAMSMARESNDPEMMRALLLRRVDRISEASCSAYRSMLLKHILPAFGLRHLRAITANELQVFVNTFAGLSKSQITIVIGILKAVMKGAYADGIIPRDPSVSLIRPKAKKKESRRALTDQERQSVLVTIERHPDGLLLAVLYYCGLRRGEALGLRWEDFGFEKATIHVQRDIDFVGSTSHDGTLKTEAADRFVPIPADLREMLIPIRGLPGVYLFHQADGRPLSQSTFKRKWLSLMEDCFCVQDREIDENTDRPNDIRKRLKPTLTPHYFRHNYITMLYEGGIDPLIAMKIVGHADYQTTANIYTHVRDEMLKKATVDLDGVFRKRAGMEV